MVAGDRGCLAGRYEKGGGQVGRSLRGRSGSRFHLIVDATGIPFEVTVGAGNENERAHLLPLLDRLLAREIRPAQLWADRGYDGEQLRAAIRERGVEPVISRRRFHGQPAAETTVRLVYRGGRRRPKTVDPNGRHRWPIERTNSWLRNWRRVSTRWERHPDYWHAVIQTCAAMVAWQILEHSFR